MHRGMEVIRIRLGEIRCTRAESALSCTEVSEQIQRGWPSIVSIWMQETWREISKARLGLQNKHTYLKATLSLSSILHEACAASLNAQNIVHSLNGCTESALAMCSSHSVRSVAGEKTWFSACHSNSHFVIPTIMTARSIPVLS